MGIDDDEIPPWLREDDKEPFDIKKFKRLRTLEEMFREASSKLTEISRGSSRIVYDLGDKVLKLSRRFDYGPTQNENEVDVFTNPRTKAIVAKIFDFDPHYYWIISEKAEPLDNIKELEQMLGAPMPLIRSIAQITKSHAEYGKRKWEVKWLEKVKANLGKSLNLINTLTQLIIENNLDIEDILCDNCSSQWGYVIRDGKKEPILVDYGLSFN